MTPSNDNQPGNNPDNQEFLRTVKLMRCQKHGVSYYAGENCPECAKENEPSCKDTASSA